MTRNKVARLATDLLLPAGPQPSSVVPHQIDVLTAAECAQAIAFAEDDAWESAAVSQQANGKPMSIQDQVRSVQQQPLPQDKARSLLEKMLAGIGELNEDRYHFELAGLIAADAPNLLHYTSMAADHYQAHKDVGKLHSTRKLSFTLQLSDTKDYRGGDLAFPTIGVSGTRAIGAMTVFPSYLVHRVTPVTSGERFAAVGWVHGPAFR